MKNWKRLLSICVGTTLCFSNVTWAEITIPPSPIAAPSVSGTESAGGETPGTGPGGSTSAGNTALNNTTTTLEEPVVVAEGAVLMDAATGKVLFGKNQDQQYYPASITKVMTALVVLENANLSDVVTFSAGATSNLESGSVSLNITAGDKLTVEQSLYGLLLKSANEIGNGLAEHVAGSVSAFAEKMNQKARELGCKNTNFANPHGLNNASHKTTPYDMALILRAALQNDTFRKIDSTLTYQFPATKKAVARTITMGHKMLYPSDSRYYQGIIGGKTGYTSLAGNTLVTGAERDGVRLIAVIMKSKGTQYTDTKTLLDYGFANYSALTGGGVTGPVAGNTDTGNQVKNGWVQDGQGWYYVKADGSKAASEWQTVDGKDYWFDSNTYMAKGWRQFTDGNWYYLKPSSGALAKSCWILDQQDWFYVGADGKLLRNTTTPDGYPVNENGIWVQAQ